MKTLAVGTVALLLTMLVGTALAARPPAGARYAGTTGQARAITLRVTSDRRGLQMAFRQTLDCNRGPSKTSSASFDRQRPTIKADGTFSYARTFELGPAPGFAEPHTERQRITGAFSADRRTVRGRIATTVTGRSGLTCKVSMRFRATRR